MTDDNGQQTITLHDIEIGVTRKGSGKPLVLLHGGGGPIAAMPFADRLAERFEVIAPTHPGFDNTPIPDRFDDIKDLAFLYLDLMDALDLGDAVLMGFSMGGWTAAEMAVMTTERIAKLILVDAVGVKPGGREDRDIADIFALRPENLAKLMWHDTANAPDPAAMSDEQMQVMVSNRTALAMYTWDPYMHDPRLQHRLHRIDVPTLLIWGESDGLVTTDYARAYRDMIPGAVLEIIAGAGHSPQTEQPKAFVEHVVQFAS
jgi:pimeloyl-ACP methyl ester carboxylesterase